jgi:hypothetical protein
MAARRCCARISASPPRLLRVGQNGVVMADEGLLWLDERFAETLNFCLMFVRGISERAVLTAVGADPDEAVPMTRHQAEEADASLAHRYGPFVRVGRSGEWLFRTYAAAQSACPARCFPARSDRQGCSAGRHTG